jgi:23S rRNA (cytidine1920-2'-O)/16S rRNA (cytidine1409-2'-O)-methyltransferase
MPRQRADLVLVDRGLFSSRERARAAVLAGEVRIGDRVLRKAGELIDVDAALSVAERPRFVSRGGDKLAGAIESFSIDVAGLKAVDVGASTGGFTDCLLQNGAESVCAIDVGYGQLAWSLRQDHRVRVLERTNIRNVEPTEVGAPFDIALADVSFIGLHVVLPTLAALVSPGGQILVLVKPQFEAGKGHVGKRGVVRDEQTHTDVLERVLDQVAGLGMAVLGLTWSPIKGPEGNIEFWVWASFSKAPAHVDVASVVAEAHERLGG